MVKRTRLLLILVLLIAGLLTFFKVPLASSQGLTLVAALITGDLPVNDFNSQLWGEATAVEVPLSAQNVSKPMLLESKVKSVTARALQNGAQIAFMLEWADETQDDSMVSVQDFRDAVALQFPLAVGQPYFCMGQQGGNVNIWHWKADWQADMLARADVDAQYPNMYVDDYPFADPTKGVNASLLDYSDPNYVPAMQAGNLFASPVHVSPVEDLIAGGFGTLTSQGAENQNVRGVGSWSEGKWRVIFSRDFSSPEADDMQFAPGKVFSVAFAVWDGANEERNGQKSTSQWVSLELIASPTPKPSAAEAEKPAAQAFWTSKNVGFIMLGIFALILLVSAFIYYRLPE